MTAVTLKLTRALRRVCTKLHSRRLLARLRASERRCEVAHRALVEANHEAKAARRRASKADRDHHYLTLAVKAELESIHE